MKRLEKNRILDTVSSALRDEPRLRLVYVFGSIASKGVSLHDVDIAVMLEDGEGYERVRTLADLVVRLAKALGVQEERVNIVDLRKAPVPLRYNVLRNGIRIRGEHQVEKRLVDELLLTYPHFTQELKDGASLDPEPKVDRAVIVSRMEELRRNIRYLKERVLSEPPEALSQEYGRLLAAERAVQRAIEALLDVCRHLVAVYDLGLVESYGEYGERLREKGLMPKELAEELQNLTGVRNILVHRYLAVDHTALYAAAESLVEHTALRFSEWVKKILEGEVRQ